jgi:hypothetical protein
MLNERARTDGKPADDAMVLGMLRDFGTPAEVAARYRSPGLVLLPAEQTRSFAILSVVGLGLQWALTLPRVFEGQPLVTWWFTWGLGALWWPGFLAMTALVAAGVRQVWPLQPVWRPRLVDPDRVRRGALAFGLVWFAIGVAVMVSLPWIVRLMPEPVPTLFAFEPAFLRGRAPPVLVLWAAAFAVKVAVFRIGRQTRLTRRLELAIGVAFIALLSWWLTSGPIFQTRATNDGARAGLSLVILVIVLDLGLKLYRQRVRIRPPRVAG